MSQPEFSMFAVTAPALEEVCALELGALGFQGCRTVPGGVEFAGDLAGLYRANLWLRTASRVLVRVGEVRARDFPRLFQQAARLPWGRFVRSETAVRVRASSRSSRLVHTGRIGETVTEAVNRALGRTPPSGGGFEQDIHVRVEEDCCLFSVDSSGELLHRRGYREEAGAAPLRETLAAGALLLLGWDGSTPLLDPCCGSGTLLIEGALIALGRAPGLSRSFAFEHWPRFRQGSWQVLREEARRREVSSPAAWIGGGDLDPEVLALALRNAERAGVAPFLELTGADLALSRPPEGEGLILCNPPYGERLGGGEDLSPLYRSLGRLASSCSPGWRLAFLSPDPALAAATGLRVERLSELVNGGLRVGLYVTGVNRGSGRSTR